LYRAPWYFSASEMQVVWALNSLPQKFWIYIHTYIYIYIHTYIYIYIYIYIYTTQGDGEKSLSGNEGGLCNFIRRGDGGFDELIGWVPLSAMWLPSGTTNASHSKNMQEGQCAFNTHDQTFAHGRPTDTHFYNTHTHIYSIYTHIYIYIILYIYIYISIHLSYLLVLLYLYLYVYTWNGRERKDVAPFWFRPASNPRKTPSSCTTPCVIPPCSFWGSHCIPHTQRKPCFLPHLVLRYFTWLCVWWRMDLPNFFGLIWADVMCRLVFAKPPNLPFSHVPLHCQNPFFPLWKTCRTVKTETMWPPPPANPNGFINTPPRGRHGAAVAAGYALKPPQCDGG
jgi:hypothetical protein